MQHSQTRMIITLALAYLLSMSALINASQDSDCNEQDPEIDWSYAAESPVYFAHDTMSNKMPGIYGTEEIIHTINWSDCVLLAEGKLEKDFARAGKNQRYKLVPSDGHNTKPFFFETPPKPKYGSSEHGLRPNIFLSAANVKFYWHKKYEHGALYAEIEVKDDPKGQCYLNPGNPCKKILAQLFFPNKGLTLSKQSLRQARDE